MRLFVITPEETTPRETAAVNALFHSGLEILHLRKPYMDEKSMRAYLQAVDPAYHNRITLHDHFSLVEVFNIGGIHMNRRNSIPLPGLRVSRSCHTIDELKEYAGSYHYLFLSPVFDSISKTGYKQAFSPEQLERARHENCINSKVIALGGITVNHVPAVRMWGFGGIALLGAVWQPFHKDQDVTGLINRYMIFRKLCEKQR